MNPPTGNIQMVDLKTQYHQLRTEMLQAIEEVLEGAQYIKGAQVQKFEQELADFTGSRFIIACANGTDALQIAMMALDLKPGDEVIIPAFTYVATAEVIALLGLTPVLVEVDPYTFNLDANSIEKAISPKTKAIVPVHLFGQSADMAAILEIAEKHHLFVIEDNAQAIGSLCEIDGKMRQTGTMGHIGTTSFFPSKNLGCYGDGGAIYTQDEALAERIRMIANHGQKVQYQHECIGLNSRLDTLQAAVLSVKLPHLDGFIRKRQEVASVYDEALGSIAGIRIPERTANTTHVFHQYTLQLEGISRDGLRAHLKEKGIPSMVYYPIPLHKQNAFASICKFEDLSLSESLCEKVLSLPMSPDLTREQQQYIIYKIKEYIQSHT